LRLGFGLGLRLGLKLRAPYLGALVDKAGRLCTLDSRLADRLELKQRAWDRGRVGVRDKGRLGVRLRNNEVRARLGLGIGLGLGRRLGLGLGRRLGLGLGLLCAESAHVCDGYLPRVERTG